MATTTAEETTTKAREATSSEMTMRNRRRLQYAINYVMMGIVGLIFLLPLLWMASTSLKPKRDWFSGTIEWIPKTFTLENYQKIFSNSSTPIERWFVNSLMVAIITTALVLLIDSLAAYAYARMEFPGRQALFGLLLATLFLPSIMFLVPNFVTVANFGLLNSYPGVILPTLAGVFGVFFLRQFFTGIPMEL